jgi:predicted transposase YdaD
MKERKPDVLKKITDEQGGTYVLQIEFQVADESDMVYRMAEYYIMLERKYRLPIRQYVVFLGSATPQMPTRPNLRFSFQLVSFAELDYQLFLQPNKPEEVLLSILANLGSRNTEATLIEIVPRVSETSQGNFSFRKHINQLSVLAQLRNLGIKLEDAMDSIEKLISPEKDVFYLMGEEKGQMKAEERIVRNLLTKMNLSVEQAADVAGVSIDFVEQVRQKMTQDK